MTIHECKDLNDYMLKFGKLLGVQASRMLRPLHTPGKNPISPAIDTLIREPLPAQKHVITAGVQQFRRDRAQKLVGEMGTGKGGCPETKVLTPRGWTTLGEISVGDVIIDPNGGTTHVTGVFRRGVMPMFRVTFTDGSSTICSDDHLWLVNTPLRKYRGQPAIVRQLSEIRGRLAHANGNLQHFVPMVKPVEFSKKTLPLHPYALGLLLGDGGMVQGTPTITSADSEIIESIATYLPNGVSVQPKGDAGIDYYLTSGRTGGTENPLTAILRSLSLWGCDSGSKFIPIEYLYSSVRDRLELLAGLFDTDGGPCSGYAVEYTSTSKQLADDVQELVRSVGGIATMSDRIPTCDYLGEKVEGARSYRLYISLPRSIAPFRLARKMLAYNPGSKYPPGRAIAHVEPAGDMECICIAVASESKLYVTDDYIVTHNTIMGMAICHCHAVDTGHDGYRGLVFCPPQLVSKWERELRITIPRCNVSLIRNYKDVMQIWHDRFFDPDRPEWFIVSREQAKRGASWEARYSTFGIKGEHGEAESDTCPRCHRCGNRITDKDGLDMPVERIQKSRMTCEGTITKMAYSADDQRGTLVETTCGEPLWSYVRDNHRRDCYEPALVIHRKLNKFFDYAIVDESHEEKGRNTEQANAFGSIAAAAKRVIDMTGTLIGGYADHVHSNLYRTSPSTLVAEEIGWSDVMKFSQVYGRVETRITETDDGGNSRTGRGKKRSTIRVSKPGIMPTLFGTHLIDKTLFLSLDEVADNLPTLTEEIVDVEMDGELASEYERVEKVLKETVASMLVNNDRRLLGSMLETLLYYPDHPYGWDWVGYWNRQDGERQFQKVVKPKKLCEETIRFKEDALLRSVAEEVANNRQCWVYVQRTGERDVAERLRHLIDTQLGLRVNILRADQVPTTKREAWIAKHGPQVDVMISHPQPVETGLDLFAPDYAHNFVTLMWYQTGYRTFTLRQASRRSWRIGQRMPCKVMYFFYKQSMQARAMSLMGQKLAASLALEGKFSSEGLAAMGGDDDDMQMAMAKSLVKAFDKEVSADRAWSKIQSMTFGNAAMLAANHIGPQLTVPVAYEDYSGKKVKTKKRQIITAVPATEVKSATESFWNQSYLF